MLYVTRMSEVINISSNINITPYTRDNIKTKEDLCGTIGGWIFYKPERILEEKIEYVKIDIYKDRYKTLITKIST